MTLASLTVPSAMDRKMPQCRRQPPWPVTEITGEQTSHQPHPVSHHFVHSVSPQSASPLILPLHWPLHVLECCWAPADIGVLLLEEWESDSQQMETVDSPLPKGLKSPKDMQTSASPLVGILPGIKRKKFMLLHIDSFQFLPTRAGL